MIKKIVIKGKAGDGVQFVGLMLSRTLTERGFNVALSHDYSPLVRKGLSYAFIIFSDEEINNPLFRDAELNYDITNESFRGELEAKGKLNMVLLSRILKDINVKVTEDEIRNFLGEKFTKENLKAILFFYED